MKRAKYHEHLEETPLFDLPKDVVVRIFRGLGWTEWKNLRLANKAINKIMLESVIHTYFEEPCKMTFTPTECADRAAILGKFKAIKHIHRMGFSKEEVGAVSPMAKNIETLKLCASTGEERFPRYMLDFLSKCTALKRLALDMDRGFCLGKEQLSKLLKSLPLQSLVLKKVELEGEGDIVEMLSSLNLTSLKLEGLSIPKESVGLLVSDSASRLSVELKLENFVLFRGGGGGGITDEDVEQLAKKFPRLKKIDLGCQFQWRITQLEILAHSCREIESLDIGKMQYGESVSELICKVFPKWPKLRKIRVGFWRGDLSEQAAQVLATHSCDLRWLSLDYADFVDDKIFKALPNLTYIRVTVRRASAKEVIERNFQYWKQLRTLVLEGDPHTQEHLSDETLSLFSNCTCLSRLVLYRCSVSEGDLNKFKQNNPRITKVWV